MSDNSSHGVYPSWLWNNQISARWADSMPQSLQRHLPSHIDTISESLSGTHLSSASSNVQLLPVAQLAYYRSPEAAMSLVSDRISTDSNCSNSSRHDACRMIQYPLNIMIPGTNHLAEPLEHVGNFSTDAHSSTASSRYLAVEGLKKADLDSGNLVEFLEKVLDLSISFYVVFHVVLCVVHVILIIISLVVLRIVRLVVLLFYSLLYFLLYFS